MHLTGQEPHGLAVVVALCPSRVVARCDGDIRVSELVAHVAALHARGEELGGEGVAEILQRPVTDARSTKIQMRRRPY